MKRSLPAVVLVCLMVAACAPKAPNTSAQPGKGSTAAAPQKSPVPSPLVGENRFGIPTTVQLQMPASIISGGAGNLVSGGAGNYGLLDVPAPDALAKSILDNAQIYFVTTRLIDDILKGVAAIQLAPGSSLTFPDPEQPNRNLTVLLEVKSDYAVVSVGVGESAKGSGQIFGVRYTSPRKGRAVMRVDDSKDGKIYLVTDFNLDADKVSADGAFDTTKLSVGNKEKVMGHWEFSRQVGATASETTYAMLGSAHVHHPENEAEDGVLAFAANFLADGSGAFVCGAQNQATGDRFVFLPRDGVSYFSDPPAAHDYYMTAAGKDLPKDKAGAAQTAIVPPDTAIYKPFPVSPKQADPFADDRFSFPD